MTQQFTKTMKSFMISSIIVSVAQFLNVVLQLVRSSTLIDVSPRNDFIEVNPVSGMIPLFIIILGIAILVGYILNTIYARRFYKVTKNSTANWLFWLHIIIFILMAIVFITFLVMVGSLVANPDFIDSVMMGTEIDPQSLGGVFSGAIILLLEFFLMGVIIIAIQVITVIFLKQEINTAAIRTLAIPTLILYLVGSILPTAILVGLGLNFISVLLALVGFGIYIYYLMRCYQESERLVGKKRDSGERIASSTNE